MKKLDVVKYRYITLIPSILIILAGLVLFFVRGFNKGIDFEAGLSERIQIAPVGMYVSYDGSDDAVLSVDANTLRLTIRNDKGAAVTSFDNASYPAVADIAAALNQIDGVHAEVVDGSLRSENLVSGFGFPAALSQDKTKINFASVTKDVLIEDIRAALSDLDINVQTVGAASDGIFQIKLKGEEGEGQKDIENKIQRLLAQSFDPEQVVILQSDFVGPKFSSALLSSSIKAVLISVALILVYIWVRFRFAYAVSSIIALMHDVAAMFAFILIFNLEVSSTTIAAVLTIIGYSLNNTIVIFDRVRENVALLKGKKVDEIIGISVAQSLTRTIITSATTLFAIVPLAIFSNGGIQLFAINLTWGIIVGTYSSNFIAPSLLHWFNKIDAIDVVKKKETNKDIHIGDAYV